MSATSTEQQQNQHNTEESRITMKWNYNMFLAPKDGSPLLLLRRTGEYVICRWINENSSSATRLITYENEKEGWWTTRDRWRIIDAVAWFDPMVLSHAERRE